MKMHRLRVACVWLCLQVLLATMRTVVALPVSGVADSRSNDRALSPAPALTQLQLQAAAGGNRDRNRRTAAESSSSSEDDDSPAMQYVKRLKDSLTDTDGNPLVSEDDPTSVWCFLDKDVLQETYRAKPSSPQKCTTSTRFIYRWHALVEAKQSRHLQKGILHTHLQVIPRLLPSTGSTEVEITVTMRPYGHNSSQSVLASQTQASISTESEGWLELNVTEGVRELWEQNSDCEEIELSVEFRVNCRDQKKVPVYLTDPASIPLSQAKRRQRYERYQPLLVISLNDEEVKEIVRKEINDIANSSTVHENSVLQQQEPAHAEKRSANSACGKEDYWINFQVLQLHYILVPHSYNAHRCSGSCSHSTLSRNENLGTNHAKIIASMKAISQYDHSIAFANTPQDPCCAPTKYESLQLITTSYDRSSINIEVYPSMIVHECGCR